MPSSSAGDASDSAIRAAAVRALARFQESQRRWYTSQACASCHHQYQPALAYRSAREHGIPFDESIAAADAGRTFAYRDLDSAVQYHQVIEPAMDDAYRLVAADAAGVRPNLVTAVYARMIASRQNPEGDWPSFHARPPMSYSRFTMTALAARAIRLYSHSSERADVDRRVIRARGWLVTHTPRDTEERTYRLLGLLWTGADRVARLSAARELAAGQREDGGWGSLDGRASDAYSTGEALVALHDAGEASATDAAWRRGLRYLLEAQAADGSWHVASRLHPPAPLSPPYFDSGYPYGHDQFISSAAASWAIMALARSLPAVPALAPAGVAPPDVGSWEVTVLFGTTRDLDRLLASGFDPNSATAPGGTTALMMAVPHVDKMKRLLDRGADVNRRTKTGYSALMVAAQYREASDAIELLLARGAKIRPRKGDSPPLYGAHPLFLAAYAGNAAILPRLRAAGDSFDEPMLVLGAASMTPLAGAVALDQIEVVRTLLDAGVPVDEADGDGLTALDGAVFGNQVALARLLIDRGADVNHVDRNGMTPLLYAASIDFGDAEMVDLLLGAGARADARTTAGLTALDLARRYRHARLIARLTSR